MVRIANTGAEGERRTISGEVPARALLLADRPAQASAGRTRPREARPRTFRLGDDRYAVAMPYGAVVLFGVAEAEEERALTELVPGEARPEVLEREDGLVLLGEEEGDTVGPAGEVRLAGMDVDRLEIVADVLAKSAVLTLYEKRVAAAFDRIEPLAQALRSGTGIRAGTRDLLRHMGEVLETEHRMVGRAEVGESPDVLWEHPELAVLHRRLAQEYELAPRDRALSRKLDLISRTVATVLEMTRNERSLRVEWYIVALILIEILLTLHDKFWAGG